MMRSNGKPLLTRSPTRLRPHSCPHQSNSISFHTTPGSGSLSKTHLPKRSLDVEETNLRPAYHTISCELRALAKMVNQEIGENDPKFGLASPGIKGNRSPLFERGKFYEKYSARRNERLKRKKSEYVVEKKSDCDYLGVRVESAKRREVKKFESTRKSVSVAATPLKERRYALRTNSMKENKKPPLGVNFDTSTVAGQKTVAKRAVVRKSLFAAWHFFPFSRMGVGNGFEFYGELWLVCIVLGIVVLSFSLGRGSCRMAAQVKELNFELRGKTLSFMLVSKKVCLWYLFFWLVFTHEDCTF